MYFTNLHKNLEKKLAIVWNFNNYLEIWKPCRVQSPLHDKIFDGDENSGLDLLRSMGDNDQLLHSQPNIWKYK